MQKTTIRIDKMVLAELKKVRRYKGQTYSELLSELVNLYKNSGHGEFDMFLDMIQQDKMKELWDNKFDEVAHK